ncbi:MAG: recombinase family protein [Planctomycetota bacterium]
MGRKNSTNFTDDDDRLDQLLGFSRDPNTESKGLPDHQTIVEMAGLYLELQAEAWPELLQKGLLPEPTDEAAEVLACELEQCFRADRVALFRQALARPRIRIGGAYLRYSDDGSNPRSLVQQLRNILNRANKDRVFIPWAYIFADAAITGTITNRRGYQLAKTAVRTAECGLDILYLDEFGRATRAMIEALRLGNLMDVCSKLLIGVSDGFDSSDPMVKMRIQFFAMLQSWFIDQLREKVRRGMEDAFRRGANVFDKAFGYRLDAAVDQNGNPVYDQRGRRKNVRAIDEEHARGVREAFRLFVDENVSKGKIARRFNDLGMGSIQWDSPLVHKLLTRDLYIGHEYYRKTRRIVDPETGAVKIQQCPKESWLHRELPHLRLIDDETWKRAQDRLRQTKEAYDRNRKEGAPTRQDVYPKTVLHAVCGCCHSRMCLARSGKYPSMCCLNGRDGKSGCKLRGNKSVQMFEELILDHVKSALMSDSFADDVLKSANHFIALSAKTPTQNLKLLRNQLQKRKKSLELIYDQVKEVTNSQVFEQITQRATQMNEDNQTLETQIAKLEMCGTVPTRQLKRADVISLVEDLPALMNDSVAKSSNVLRRLIGPVIIEQKGVKPARGTNWVARFRWNAGEVLLELSKRRNCPTSGMLEFLTTRGWTLAHTTELSLDKPPKYERIADEVLQMKARGCGVETIRRHFKTDWETVHAAIQFAEGRIRTPSKKPGRRTGMRGQPKFKVLAAEVCRLRDEGLPFKEIAKRLEISQSTATQAYDIARPASLQAAIEKGGRPQRGQYVRIPGEIRRDVQKRLAAGNSVVEIESKVNCSASTIRRIRAHVALGRGVPAGEMEILASRPFV